MADPLQPVLPIASWAEGCCSRLLIATVSRLKLVADVDQRFLFFKDGNTRWKTDGTVAAMI